MVEKYIHSIGLQLKSTSVPRAKFMHFPVLHGQISIATSMLASSLLSKSCPPFRTHNYYFICNKCGNKIIISSGKIKFPQFPLSLLLIRQTSQVLFLNTYIITPLADPRHFIYFTFLSVFGWKLALQALGRFPLRMRDIIPDKRSLEPV